MAAVDGNGTRRPWECPHQRKIKGANCSNSNPTKSESRLQHLSLLAQPLHLFGRDIEIGVDILNIVRVFERLHSFSIVSAFFPSSFTDVCGIMLISATVYFMFFSSKTFFTFSKPAVRDYFDDPVIFPDVFGPRIEGQFHDLVFVNAVFQRKCSLSCWKIQATLPASPRLPLYLEKM